MENDEPKLKLRGFRDSLVNDKLENNNMATAAQQPVAPYQRGPMRHGPSIFQKPNG